MINTRVDPQSAQDIDLQVAKILRDLGNPEPPLQLEHVRELLRLGKEFYSSLDDSSLRRFVNQLRVAGKQIADRPAFIIDFVKSFRLDALCLLDEKRILISNDLPTPKQRWAEGHEIGHAIIPWHGPISHGDNKYTLSPDYSDILESEANYAARRLLFLRDRFDYYALSSPLSLDHVNYLKGIFGNSMTTTFYGLIEVQQTPAFGLISRHPASDGDIEGVDNPCRHFVRSHSFERSFGHISDLQLFNIAKSYCRPGRWKIGQSRQVLTDINGDEFEFDMESLFNSYDALTLGLLKGKCIRRASHVVGTTLASSN